LHNIIIANTSALLHSQAYKTSGEAAEKGYPQDVGLSMQTIETNSEPQPQGEATTAHSAAGAAAGFTYQFGRALWWLATKPGVCWH